MTITVHLVTGFLGAGKTSVIGALLATRPAGERWAVLVNEFGRIGIDQAAWPVEGVVVKAVPGGCMCCAQHLGMQIALGQLVSEPGITRLLIEPSGLGHPVQIQDALTAPHWQHYLQLGASLCVVDGQQWAQPAIREHETFQAQLQLADVVVLSKTDRLAPELLAAVTADMAALVPARRAVVRSGRTARGEVELDPSCLAQAPLQGVRRQRSLLHPRPGSLPGRAEAAPAPVGEPPYHYHQQALAHEVGGWVLPAAWQFAHDPVVTLLQAWRQAPLVRLKGVLQTDRGWWFFNGTDEALSIGASEYRADNRLELILTQAWDWSAGERQLLRCLLPARAPAEQGEQPQNGRQ